MNRRLDDDPAEERRLFTIIAAVMAVVMLATAIGFFLLVIVRPGEEDAPPAAPSPTTTPTAAPTPEPVEGARLTGPTPLRSGPGDNVAILTRLAETDAIRVMGRTPEGDWLAVSPVDRPELVGWVPASLVEGVEPAALAVIAPPGGTPPPGGAATLTPDLPDLLLERLSSVDNRLVAHVLNQGAGDALGEIRVSVGGGEAVVLGAKPGEPLRAGQRLISEVPDHYVQLRSTYTALLVPTPDRLEEDDANNSWSGIVEPDQPNDVEVVRAHLDTAEGGQLLVVEVRNNSPIPIAGQLSITIREALPSTTLIARRTEGAEIEAAATVTFEFDDLPDIDLTRITISVSMNAIDDAQLSNNVYPR